MMLDLTLDELKNYLRIDEDEDDGLLALLIDGAKEYLMNAGVVESNQALYKLAVMLYVALHYENRDPSVKMERFNCALEGVVLQLKGR
jgi:uncharacterized phage protein (predicted DNA packaging)